jgi:hypothetical protein
MQELPQHTYEELRSIVIDILTKTDSGINQLWPLLNVVADELKRQHGISSPESTPADYLHRADKGSRDRDSLGLVSAGNYYSRLG